jgi:superfamily I DNA/RNA helicase
VAVTTLSEIQQAIVEQAVDTPAILVDAGPGSGKTRVLGERIRWLLQNGVEPRAIVALTFTQQAARELRARLTDISPDVRAQTIHGHAHQLIRDHGKRWGWTEPVRVIATYEQARALQRVFVDDLGWDCPDAHAVNLLKQISHRKRLGLEIGQHRYHAGYGHSQAELERIDRAYCHDNRQTHRLDFDDLISEAARGLRGDTRRVRSPLWLFVDEFHDISLDQYELIRLLAPPAATDARLFTIWDRRQSIYRFRGADTRRVAARLYTDYRPLLLRMNDNYRSTGNVIRVANALVPNGRSPELMATRAEPGRVVEIQCRDEVDEAESVAGLVQRRIAEGDLPGSIAVLYAKHERGDRIERSLLRQGIAVRRVLGRSLTSHGSVRGLETLLTIAAGNAPEREQLRELSLELGPLLDEVDWLGLTIGESGRVEARMPDIDACLAERIGRFNELLDRAALLNRAGSLRALGDAVIDAMVRAASAWPAAEFDGAIPDRSYVAIDVETTSRYVESAQIFDLAAIRFDRLGNRIGAPFTAVVRGVPVPAVIRRLTGIDSAELNAGVDAAGALPGLRDWLTPEDVLVGHALADFDLPVINRHLLALGQAPLRNDVLDTLPLARRLYPHQSRRLEDLATSFGFPARRHHRALPDVETTIDLFFRIVDDRGRNAADPALGDRDDRFPARAIDWNDLREQWHRVLDLAPPGHDLAGVLSLLSLTGDDARRERDDAVQMMTIHSSKGLEWDTVILAGIEDDLFPFGQNPSEEEIEEARRLLYVGVTRTRERLAIFHACRRDGAPKSPSRFLADLPDDPAMLFRRRLQAQPAIPVKTVITRELVARR